jgi:hypothetical protein
MARRKKARPSSSQRGETSPDAVGNDTGSLGVLQDEIKELRSEMERVTRPYEEMAKKIDTLSQYAERYLHLLGIIASNGTVSPALAVPDVKDSIARDIITVLAEKSPLNISQLANALKEKRGSASRRIIRERLKELLDKGHVVVIRDKINSYSLSEEVVLKWSQMLTGLK